MTVYIEYAFLENFLLDGALLWLSARAARVSVRWLWLTVGAAVGGSFAVAYPLMRLPSWLGTLLKIAVGLLMPMLVLGKVKTKREWRSYALCATLFFALAFAFGGALFGGMQSFSLARLPSAAIACGFFILAGVTLLLTEKLYKRRAIFKYIYECSLSYGGKTVRLRGFLDSGNRATSGGIPVCFLSAEIFYELVGYEIVFGSKGEGQVCDEMQICTMAGVRKLPLYKGLLQVKAEKKRVEKEVYFAAATNMLSREYKILLNGDILEEVECGV